MSYEKQADLTVRLEKWQSKQDYTEGLRLYREIHGENILYKTMLRGANSFNQRKLSEALLTQLESLRQTTAAQLIAEPRSIAEYRRNASALMNERTALKAQIRMLTDEEERRPRAFRILEICDELDVLYGQIEFFERNGTVWEPPAEAESDDAIVRKYLNLRTYISRTAKALEVAILPTKRSMLEAKLKGFAAEKAQLELTDAVKKYNGHAV